MTRSAKDLRDIINVSRLSIRTSSEDEYSSDDIPINLEAKNNMKLNQYLNNRPTSAVGESSFDTLPIQTRPKSAARNRDSNSFYQIRPSTAPNGYKENPAAIYRTSSGRNTVPGVNYKITDTESFNKYTPIPPIAKPVKNSKQKNFDNLFPYLDTTVINGWLEELNSKLEYINKFMKKSTNFLEFANFFLVDLPSEKYKELLDLEFSIILDQLKYAFHAGFSEDAINTKDLHTLATSVIKEYPKKLKKEKKGPELLLNITLIFCSEKDETYRKLLRNVNCFTDNKLYIQWLLAIRAFGLIGFITGIFKFFENIQQLQEIFNNKTEESDSINKGRLNLDELAILCIKKGYMRVLRFFSDHCHVSLKKVRDKKSRNLLFVAVAEGNIEAINYLVKNGVDVNEKSDNGSSPLFYAVNKNDHEITELLLKLGGDINVWNEQCEGATPLHSAVMLGDLEMVSLLMRFDADRNATMGVPATITPLSIAQELQHEDIEELLKL